MSRHEDNPFVRFGLDRGAPLAEIAVRLRELAEDASEAERTELRAAWNALSRSPAQRLELALEAGPTPIPLASVSPPSRPPAWPEPTLADVLAPPALTPLLPAETLGERGMRSTDLSFLVTQPEIDAAGSLERRRSR